MAFTLIKVAAPALLLAFVSITPVASDPAPLPPMNTCSLHPAKDDAAYCGTKTNKQYPFGDGCFAQKLVTPGCDDVTPPGERAVLCKWTTIYPSIEAMSPRDLCLNQKSWCDNHVPKFSNCVQIEKDCEAEINTFKAKCV